MIRSIAQRTFARLWLPVLLCGLLRRPDRLVAVAYWHVTGRRVRARNRFRDAVGGTPLAYQLWMRTVERPTLAAFDRSRESAGGPRFDILLHAPSWTGRAAFERTMASIMSQSEHDGAVIVTGAIPTDARIWAGARITHLLCAGADAAAALESGLAVAHGDYVIIMPADGLLPRNALARYRQAARETPGIALFYGDQDYVDAAGRRGQPWFKPQWNEELLLAQDYVSQACAIARSRMQSAGNIPPEFAECVVYALLLAIMLQPGVKVQHLAQVLCHLPVSTQRDADARLLAVSKWMEARGGRAEAGPFSSVRVHWPVPDPAPLVTIIVPTRDKSDLLEDCIGSLLRETSYSNYEVVIVDNGSVESKTHAWFAKMTVDPRISILPYDHPYNYSAINNFAAERAKGSYLCLLNNDTEIVDGAWLTALMGYATRSEIGAVGAKLLYADGSIQHAGVVIGLGEAAGHAHRALPNDEPGYFAMAHSAQYVSAVTAACLVIDRTKFQSVGGFDAKELQIAYNDVDLCLKLGRAGWRNVYAPQAVLIHHESKSRGCDISAEHIGRYRRELAVLQSRWGTVDIVDAGHHPHLDRGSESYRIRF